MTQRGMGTAMLAAIVMVSSLDAAQSPKNAVSASQRISQAIEAMGGEARLSAIKSLSIESMGHGWALEQSERPEGPWLTIYQQTTELRDLEHGRRSQQLQSRSWNNPTWSQPVTTIATRDAAARQFGTRWIPGVPADVKGTNYLFDLAPERLLLTARSAADLKVLPDETQQKVLNNVLGFTYGGERMRLFLNAWTHLPTMLEITKQESSFTSWGDVTYRRWFSYWTLEPTGFLYPHQTTTEWNGYPQLDFTVHALTVNPVLDETKFAMPDDTKAAFTAAVAKPAPSPVTFDAKRANDINSWLVQVPSGYNVAFVKQPDGIVIIESVGTPAYSATVLDYVKTKFPGLPVKAVVTTSDAWPHFGGIREYIARGIPIYPLDLNVPILTRNAKAPFTFAPDSLAKAPRAPIFRPVSARTTIGTGESRIELIPVRGETGERMMLAWLPGAKMLYSSDLIQRNAPGAANPFFMPMMLAEVEAVVEREKLANVETVFGMHLTPTPWSTVKDAIRLAGAGAAAAASTDLPRTATAQQHIARAMTAMGGEPRLTSLKSLMLDTSGHNWAIEQSERPEGPWLSTYVEGVETRDFEHDRRRVEAKRRNWSFPKWSAPAISVINGAVSARTDGTRWAAGAAADIKSMSETYALSPEKLLFTARSAPDLKVLPDEKQQNVNQHVLGFTWNSQPLRLYLNAWTGLPTMLEITRDETRFARWGDVKERRWYTFWTLEKGGLMYPRQTSVEWNGFTFSDETVHVLKVDEALDETKLTIPEDTKAAFTANAAKPAVAPAPSAPFDESKAIAISDWVVELPSGYNVTLVKQPDGVLVFEATTNNAHAAAVLAYAAKKFPGSRVKAVISTSDAWPHIGGVREYVEHGIPIYALDLNVSILSRFVAAKHTLVPDALSRAPKAPLFKPVSGKTVIGAGDTRVEIIPVRGETGERMMMVWIPGVHALYTSDLIQRSARANSANPFFQPSMLMEVADAVAREKITGIDKIFGMHLVPTPWSEALAAIDLARK